MTEVLFYHLQHQPLERVLPQLLERSYERGWRVVVQAASDERVDALDAHLWTYRDDNFLPHGTARDSDAQLQPILLTTADHNPNGATVRFLVDGVPMPADAGGYDRVVLLFDGEDEEAVAAARVRWGEAKAQGFRGHLLAAGRTGPLGQEGLIARMDVNDCGRQDGDAKLVLCPPQVDGFGDRPWGLPQEFRCCRRGWRFALAPARCRKPIHSALPMRRHCFVRCR